MLFGKLTEKEYEIMKYIWDNEDGITFNEIYTYAAPSSSSLKRQTINTHIYHLTQKGFVRAEGAERKRIYYPLISRMEYDSSLATNIVEQLFDGSLKKFMSALTTSRTLTDVEVSELKSLIKRRG